MPAPTEDPVASAIAKVTVRLIPFLFLLYLLAFLDRVNVGFAALSMNADLGFGPAVYGLGAGIFFIGYCLFEVPSNLVLYRTGARVWIARIMVSWGIIASLMMLVHTPLSFYGFRFLLGVAEAGFFPGIIFYLTYWYPSRARARAYAWFLAAIPICGVIGSPVSGALLGLEGVLGLKGWQWLFLLEGIPSVLVGFLVLRLLPDRPAHARWLTPAEQEGLEQSLALERAQPHANHSGSLRAAVANPMVWGLGLVYFCLVLTLYGFALWLPQLIKAAGTFSNFEVGLLTAIPYAVAAVGMVLVGRHSDRTGERHLHLALAAFVGAIGLWLVGETHSTVWLVASLAVAAFGIMGWLGPFWAMPTAFLREEAAAGGVALINSMGAFGGFVGPYLLGKLKQGSGNFDSGLILLEAGMVVGAAVTLILRARQRTLLPEPDPGAVGA